MAKKRPSVEEILAQARQQDGGGSAEAAEQSAPEDEAPSAAADEAVEDASAATEEPAASAEAEEAKKKLESGKRPSVAEMLAMARGEQSAAKAASKPAAPKEQPKPAPAKSAEKPAAKKAPAKPSQKPGEAKPTTASILEAARAEKKRGPRTKAEAGIKPDSEVEREQREKQGPVQESEPVKAKPKGKAAPPMPAKPDYAKKRPPAKKADEERRGFVVMMGLMVGTFLGAGFTALTATLGLWTLGFARFMFPNVLTEPPSRFKVGFPTDFAPGQVETKFKAQYSVWVVNGVYNGQPQIYALSTVCTHLGCTPNWLEAEQKFKCPCHGSGFYKDGINFEGPAPRPLERFAIRLADDGQVEIDKSQIFQEEKGEWEDGASFVVA